MSRLRRRLERAGLGGGAAIAAAVAAFHIGLLLSIIARRVGFPLDLEWMESGMLCHALRVMEGKPIYAEPSVDFISYLYTPLYPMVVGTLGRFFGVSYVLGRTVSVVSFGIACALAFRVVQRQSDDRWIGALWGVATLGLIASSFPLSGAWFDLVRNDSLYLALVSGGLYLLCYHHRRLSMVALAGVLMGSAFLAKQTASLFIVFSGAALMLISWRRLLLYVPLVGAVAGGGVLLFNKLTGGWFWRYVFELHQGHDLYLTRIWPETEVALLRMFPVVGGLLGLWLIGALGSWIGGRRAPTPRERRSLYWWFVALLGVLVSAVGFATQWAESNAYIPAFFFCSILAGVAGIDLCRWAGGRRRALLAGLVSLVVGGAIAAQLYERLYEARAHVPSRKAWRAATALLDRLARVDGPILAPYHPFYPYLVGQPTHFHQMGVNDVTRAGYPFPKGIRRRLVSGHYAALLLDTPPGPRYGFALARYKFAHYLRAHDAPGMMTGFRVRPRYLLVRKQPDPVAPGARRVFGFESGDYKRWTLSGDAFGERPLGGPRGNQWLAGPYEGSYLAGTHFGGDQRVGKALSPLFVVDKPVLSYRVGGGRSPGIQVRLLVDGQQVHRGSGTNNHIMQRRRVDVRAHLGKQMRVELVDDARGTWGHLFFDDLTLHAR